MKNYQFEGVPYLTGHERKKDISYHNKAFLDKSKLNK